ncbi:MAG TPA: M23 family metallopeptidase [Alphaproteobacteria bacterium]|jgi:murein DD-endopeptidase MepM/ murein hydrolase activator NlpD|nr:M23 family metallopeptidase [Alphaproteobacteria bacterium]
MIATLPALAAERLRIETPVEQGALVMGATEPGARLTLDGAQVPVAPDGRFVFGLDRDAPATATLAAVYRDGTGETRALAVAKRPWDIQRVDGLPQKMVEPDPKDLPRIKREYEMIVAARAGTTAAEYYRQKFIWPAQGRISGIFGSQRILNGTPSAPHYGVDVAAPTGAPVVAPADGVIKLAQPDMYFTGNTVLIDHGYGVSSLLIHLSALAVKVGQRVKQGELIGQVGATGRATGPHLHWGLHWYQVRVDPQLMVGPMPAPEPAATESKAGQ